MLDDVMRVQWEVKCIVPELLVLGNIVLVGKLHGKRGSYFN